MKNLFLIIITSLLPILSYAQTSGKATYTETTILSEEQKEKMSQFSGLLSSMPTPVRQLSFDQVHASYIDVSKTTESESTIEEGDGSVMKIQFVHEQSEDNFYVNFRDKKISDKREFFGKDFLIDRPYDAYAWKLIPEMREIKGYACMKATSKDAKDNEITAWYTLSVPVPGGPAGYVGLPGLILEVETKGLKIEMTELVLQDDVIIKVPTKGKKVSAEKFQKIQDDKMAELEEMNGGSGARVFKIGG